MFEADGVQVSVHGDDFSDRADHIDRRRIDLRDAIGCIGEVGPRKVVGVERRGVGKRVDIEGEGGIRVAEVRYVLGQSVDGGVERGSEVGC